MILPTLAFVLVSGCAAHAGGPRPLRPMFAAADLTVGVTTDVVVTTAASVNVALPPAAASGTGRTITVRARDGAATVRATAPDSIDGQPSLALDAGEMATLMSDGGSSWVVISISDL